MDDQTFDYHVRLLKFNWDSWNDLERASVVVLLCDDGASRRKLAKFIGCSEGLIRHMEILGCMPDSWQQLLTRHSTRQLVAAWRAERRRQGLPVKP
jgi:hypothetical protein